MQKISPCLWFDDQAEDAANFYVSIFRNSAILDVSRYGEGAPGPAGSAVADRPACPGRAPGRRRERKLPR